MKIHAIAVWDVWKPLASDHSPLDDRISYSASGPGTGRFTLKDPSLDAKFLQEAEARGLSQLKGHRSVGGMRASIYNAMPMEGVEALVDFLEEFRAQNS